MGDGFYPARCLVSSAGDKLWLNLLQTDEHADRRDKLHDRLLQEMNATDDAFHGQAWADCERHVATSTHPG